MLHIVASIAFHTVLDHASKRFSVLETPCSNMEQRRKPMRRVKKQLNKNQAERNTSPAQLI